jgi:hypothetical protein
MEIQRQWDAFSFVSKVLTISALTAVAPFVMVAFVPLIMFMLPCAFIVLPFVVAAFSTETVQIRESLRPPMRVLQPQHA